MVVSIGPLPFYLQQPEHFQLISALEFQEVALSRSSHDPTNKTGVHESHITHSNTHISKGTSKPFTVQLDRLFWRLDLSLEDSRDASLDPTAMSSVKTCSTLNMYTDSTSHNSHQLSCWINTCSSSLVTLTGVAVRKDKRKHYLVDSLPFACFSRLNRYET